MAPNIRVVGAEVQRDGLYLITQRLPHAVLPLLWEFPGGRVHEGEPDVAALARAVRGRLGVEVTVGERVLEITHDYEGYTLTMAVYRCALRGEPQPLNVAQLAWVAPEALGDYDFPGADQHTVDLLLSES